MWGPVVPVEEVRAQQPPLIGNRRQGPDLTNVGARRSTLWLKAHFYNPAEVSGSSVMPSYGFLFDDERGDDLVAYLESLQTEGTAQHSEEERQWRPLAAAIAQANLADGGRLYQRDCANCHAADGATLRAWRTSFRQLPSNLAVGPYLHLQPSDSQQQRMIHLAQIAKFGIPGTDMPGHEYLPDADIASISLWLSRVIAQSGQQPQNSFQSGEK
jgi:cytochrome c oxidase cbb3-type subunit 2